MTVSQHVESQPLAGSPRIGMALAIATACALLALAVRLWRLGENSLWIDEALSWSSARLSFFELTHAASNHHDGPLYYAVLAVWMKVAGDSEIALRMPSALAGVITVFLLSWAAWRAGGPLLGAVAGVLLALNAPAVAFSQEARMYPLTGLLALGASMLLASFVVRPSVVRLCGYTLLAIGLVYAHYSGWVVLTIHGALFAGYGVLHVWSRRDVRVLAGGIVAFALIGIAYIPWYGHFLRSANAGVPIPVPDWDVVSSVTRSSLGLDLAGRGWVFIALPLFVLAVAGIARRINDPMVICVSAVALVPVAMLDISLVRTSVFNLKQISPYIPGVCFVAAIGIVDAGWLLRGLRVPPRIAISVSLVAAAMLATSAFIDTAHRHEGPPVQDWREATADLRDGHEPVYVWQFFADVSARYYLGAKNPSRPLTPPLVAAAADGYVPVVWSQPGDEATLIISQSKQPETATILNSLRPYFSITEPVPYSGLHVYSLRANTIAEYNVSLDVTPAAWIATADGELQSGAHAQFELRSGAAAAPFTLHVEYLDAGSDSFTISSTSSRRDPVVIATIPFTGSNTWRTVDVPVATPSALDKTFVISPGVTIRTLEMRRYDLEGADVLRSNRSDLRQWFLRLDGYLETIGAAVCVRPSGHIDPAATPTMTIDVTYLNAYVWVTKTVTVPAVDGLSCPILMPVPIIVRSVVVRATP